MNADITVVVPYYNEKDTIEYTLEQIGKQSLPAKQAFFVNSSSTDGTSDIVNQWIQKNQHRFNTQFKNLYENTHNPGSSKNVGVRHADTEWIAFMDCGQNFGVDWLEKQYNFSKENGTDVVSGVVYLDGENWVDRCAVAQTYGYKRKRPCIPTTFIKRDAFEQTGLFIEGRRAGYDAVWLAKVKKTGLRRGVNEEVKIHYIGTSFASNLSSLYRKSALYAKATVGLEGYLAPFLYIFFPLLVLGLFVISPMVGWGVTSAYFLTRTFLLPAIKSRSILYYKEHPFESLLGLGLVGFLMDVGKLKGTMQGILLHLLKPSIVAGWL